MMPKKGQKLSEEHRRKIRAGIRASKEARARALAVPVDVLARPLNDPNYATARGEERRVSIEIRAGSSMVFTIDGLVLEVKATA